MSEFKTGYVDAYKAEMQALFDLSDELPLFHTPGIYIANNESADSAHYVVEGESINESDKNQYVGIALASIALEDIRTRVKMELLMLEADKIPQDADPEDYKAEIDTMVARVVGLVDAAGYAYSEYNFYDHDNEEAITVAISKISNDDVQLSVSELKITTADDYVKKEVVINKTSTSSGEESFDISQTLHPVNNSTVEEATQFFYDNGAPADAEAILAIYSNELMGAVDVTSQEAYLMEKYRSSDKFSTLQRIVKDLKEQGRQAKQSGIFQRTNPEMTLPSSDELVKYKSLLDKARS